VCELRRASEGLERNGEGGGWKRYAEEEIYRMTSTRLVEGIYKQDERGEIDSL